MHATIRRYDGVDQNRSAELTRRVNETLVPKLEKLSGFAGYWLIEAGNGVFSSLGLFETPEQSKESTNVVVTWIREEKLETLIPTSPRSRVARSSLTATASWSRSSTAPQFDGRPGLPGPLSFPAAAAPRSTRRWSSSWRRACLRRAHVVPRRSSTHLRPPSDQRRRPRLSATSSGTSKATFGPA
jgi:hypothetical protein